MVIEKDPCRRCGHPITRLNYAPPTYNMLNMSTIALPIKVQVREWYGKAWLALHLLNRGHQVAIGDLAGINNNSIYNIQPDFYLSPRSNLEQSPVIETLADSGCLIGVLDEESGAFGDNYAENHISDFMTDITSLFFAWGDESESEVSSHTSISTSNIYAPGNPRFDLLQPNLREIYRTAADELTQKFGNYILINTNFGVNTKSRYADRKYDRIRDMARDAERWYGANILLKFIEMVREIRNSDIQDTIVIRPHPKEDIEFYENIFQDSSSIVVEFSGDVRPWIMGADAVIHNNCTTGIETAMLDVPLINYEPEINVGTNSRSHISGKISLAATTANEVIDIIANLDEYDSSLHEMDGRKELLSKYFNNVDKLAAPEMAEIITNSIQEGISLSYPQASSLDKVKSWLKQRHIATTIKRVRDRADPNTKYIPDRHWFPGLPEEELVGVLTQLQDISSMDQFEFETHKIDTIYDSYIVEPV